MDTHKHTLTTSTGKKSIEYKWYSREKRQSKYNRNTHSMIQCVYCVYLRRYVIQLTDWKSHKYWHKDGRKKEANDVDVDDDGIDEEAGTERETKKMKKKKKNEWIQSNGIVRNERNFWSGYSFVLCVVLCCAGARSFSSSCKSISSSIVCYIHSIQNWISDCKHTANAFGLIFLIHL